jgi:hypothetical protein
MAMMVTAGRADIGSNLTAMTSISVQAGANIIWQSDENFGTDCHNTTGFAVSNGVGGIAIVF